MTEPIDHDRRVFSVPITYSVKCILHVLARDVVEARIKAEKLDDSELDALVGFDQDQVWVNSAERLTIDDVVVTAEAMDAIDAKPNPDYDPADHPDWAPIPIR